MNALALCKYELLQAFDAFEGCARDNFRTAALVGWPPSEDAGPAPSTELARKVQLINSQGLGGQVSTGVTLRGPHPRHGVETVRSWGSQPKGDSHPRLVRAVWSSPKVRGQPAESWS